MIETKLRINRGNRGQLFRATWLSSARCSETFRRTTERVEWQRLRTGLNPPDSCPRHGVTTNNEQRTRKCRCRFNTVISLQKLSLNLYFVRERKPYPIYVFGAGTRAIRHSVDIG